MDVSERNNEKITLRNDFVINVTEKKVSNRTKYRNKKSCINDIEKIISFRYVMTFFSVTLITKSFRYVIFSLFRSETSILFCLSFFVYQKQIVNQINSCSEGT